MTEKEQLIEIIEREKMMVNKNRFLTPREKDNKIKQLNEILK